MQLNFSHHLIFFINLLPLTIQNYISKWLLGPIKSGHFIHNFRLVIMQVNIRCLWEGTQETQEILFEVKIELNGLLLIKIMMVFGAEEIVQVLLDQVGMHSAANHANLM